MADADEPLDRLGAPRSGRPLQVQQSSARAATTPSRSNTWPQGEWNDPEWLERARTHATRFTLSEGAGKALELKLASGG